MQALAHSTGCRVAAALLALALSGVARALPAHPVGPHKCQCRAQGAEHVCACPVCRAEARRAKASAAASEGDLPACHRAAAAQARKAEDDAERHRESSSCLVASCGLLEGGLAAPTSIDAFTLPQLPPVARVEWAAVRQDGERAASCRDSSPEPPRPKS